MERPKLIVEFKENGSISVNGPIGDKVLAYGMLEAAKDAIREYNVAQQRLVQPATVIPFPSGNAAGH